MCPGADFRDVAAYEARTCWRIARWWWCRRHHTCSCYRRRTRWACLCSARARGWWPSGAISTCGCAPAHTPCPSNTAPRDSRMWKHGVCSEIEGAGSASLQHVGCEVLKPRVSHVLAVAADQLRECNGPTQLPQLHVHHKGGGSRRCHKRPRERSLHLLPLSLPLTTHRAHRACARRRGYARSCPRATVAPPTRGRTTRRRSRP